MRQTILAGKIATGLIGLALAMTAAQAEEGTGCKRLRYASLPIGYSDANQPTIEATINGEKIRMVVDTGAIDSELSDRLVTRQNLPTTRLELEARVYDVEGKPIIKKTQVANFAIGIMSAKDFPFLVMPPNSVGERFGFDGILGPDILANYDIEIDFAAGKLNFFAHDECPGRVTYWSAQPYGALPFTSDGYHMVAHATLDGEPIDVRIDTGATTTFMSDKVAREIGIDTTKLTPLNEVAMPGETRYTYRFKTLEMAGLTLSNGEAIVYPERTAVISNMTDSRPTITLGISTLRQLHIYIAYKEKKLYFTHADAR